MESQAFWPGSKWAAARDLARVSVLTSLGFCLLIWKVGAQSPPPLPADLLLGCGVSGPGRGLSWWKCRQVGEECVPDLHCPGRLMAKKSGL